MNNQEAFDKVLAHLRKQGRAAKQNRMCMYRAPDGCMCAVGCLIPDDEYYDGMEGMPFSKFIDKTPSLHVVNTKLLGYMQSAHDTKLRYNGIKSWEREMDRIAFIYGLKINTR